MQQSMRGKTAVVTGATAGIGFETARELAGMGAKIVIISRSKERCQAAVAQIKSQTGNQNIDYIAGDLSHMAGVQQAAYEFKRTYPRLDVLVNNAGALFTSRLLSADGYEMTLALNHLNYFLLTHLLLDLIKSSAPARIVNVASEAHRGSQINFDDLQSEKNYQGFQAYGQSKLANVLFTYELARKLEGSRVTANALHPGFVATNFATNNGWFFKLGMRIASLFAYSPEKGARTSIYLASSPAVEGVTGKYFSDSKAVDSDRITYDKTTAAKLWQVSLELIGKAM